jgi:hypothetical protein
LLEQPRTTIAAHNDPQTFELDHDFRFCTAAPPTRFEKREQRA